MHRTWIAALVASSLSVGVLPAMVLAADLPPASRFADDPRTLAAPAPVAWSGFYVGAQAGALWGAGSFASSPGPVQAIFGAASFSQNTSPNGVAGGVLAGYNFQFQSLVAGIEADISASGAQASSTLINPPLIPAGLITGSNQIVSAKIAWFGTLRARAGFAIDRALLYATGGLIYGGLKASSTTVYTPLPPFTYIGAASTTKAGWTLGGGVEYQLSDKWTARLEGLYFDLGKLAYTAMPQAATPPFFVAQSVRFTGAIARVGINYRF